MLRPDTGARVGGRVNEHLVVTHVVRETMEENRLITYIVERRLDLRPAHVRMIAHPALLTSGFGRASGRTHAESEVVPATPAPARRTRLIWARPSPNTALAVGAHVNPNAGHREVWIRDLDGYLVVFAERDDPPLSGGNASYPPHCPHPSRQERTHRVWPAHCSRSLN